MTSRKILITGGAGYIGSHVVKQLGNQGHQAIILDDLSTGTAESVLHGELIIGDLGDADLVLSLLQDYAIDTVMHFAAHTCVPESMIDPIKYYQNNTCKSATLLQCCQKVGIKHFIFSSTAAVYGNPRHGVANENTPTRPINPYGASKLMTERMLQDLSDASSMNHVTLRYFNVAGADPEGRLGLSKPNSTLLIKVACETALGIRPWLAVFGTDFPTVDGTGVRDYIHVSDLADAHLKALDYLYSKGKSVTLNCGYGHGYSVNEVLAAVERVHGAPLPIRQESPRVGDPPMLIADADRIRALLNWTPNFDDLDFIVKTALDWEKKLLKRKRVHHRSFDAVVSL